MADYCSRVLALESPLHYIIILEGEGAPAIPVGVEVFSYVGEVRAGGGVVDLSFVSEFGVFDHMGVLRFLSINSSSRSIPHLRSDKIS